MDIKLLMNNGYDFYLKKIIKKFITVLDNYQIF